MNSEYMPVKISWCYCKPANIIKHGVLFIPHHSHIHTSELLKCELAFLTDEHHLSCKLDYQTSSMVNLCCGSLKSQYNRFWLCTQIW